MDIHEYQAKELLAEFGVQTPKGGLAYSPEQAVYRAKEIGGDKWVVKAQIHSGARGKAGGIRVCSNDTEIWDAADDLLGKKLVTHQTGPQGKVVHRLYIEGGADIERELYLGLARKLCCHEVFSNVAGIVGRRSIDFTGVLAREGSSSMATPAAIGVNDDLSARQARVALGPADHEAPCGINVELGVFVDELARHHLVDHLV